MRIRTALALALFCLALSPVATEAGQAQDDQSACMNDAMTVCGQFIPDRERVGACLAANKSRISAACRTAMTRWGHPSASRASSVR